MESVWSATHPTAPSPLEPFRPGEAADTVIAGAGLTGLVTAVLLARAGQKVVVLEPLAVGAVTTGRTTGKLSLLQGLTCSRMLARQSEEVGRAYLDGNREGKAWLLRFLADREVPYEVRDAYTYAVTEDGLGVLEQEAEASERLGLGATWTDDAALPYPVLGALRLPDQAQLSPLLVLDALVAELTAHGGRLVQARLTDVESDDGVTVVTDAGRMTADRVVLATGIPVVDRAAYFARLVPQRSYVTVFEVPGEIPTGMYLSTDDPVRSLRTVPLPGRELLMVGGNGHVGGRFDRASDALADLESWTVEHFPGATRAYGWSAQDYEPIDRVPYVGAMQGQERLLLATGYNKWGMANAVAAGLALSARVLGGSMPWAETLYGRGPSAAAAVGAVPANARTGAEMASGWVGATLHGLPEQPPAEGEGVVGRGSGAKPEAVSTVAGVTCRVSAVCPHLGGIVRWNDAELSWDCPLHGSRFAPDGTLLEGPATAGLATEEAAAT